MLKDIEKPRNQIEKELFELGFNRNNQKINGFVPHYTFNHGLDVVFILGKDYWISKIEKIKKAYENFDYTVYGIMSNQAPSVAPYDWIGYNLTLLHINQEQKTQKVQWAEDNKNLELVDYDLGGFSELFKFVATYSNSYLEELLEAIEDWTVFKKITEYGRVILDNGPIYGRHYNLIHKKVAYSLVERGIKYNNKDVAFPYFQKFIELFMEDYERNPDSLIQIEGTNLGDVICFLIESILNRNFTHLWETELRRFYNRNNERILWKKEQ